MLTWFIPSFHGDIKLEATEEGTRVHAFSMTDEEILAMQALREKALTKPIFTSPWALPEEFPPVREALCRTDQGMKVSLRAPIQKVSSFLAKRLKPGRQLLTAVRFSNGRLEELRSPAKPSDSPSFREVVEQVASPVAVTVAVPNRGCPIPEFEKAELRANRVLESFLKGDQIEDFRRQNRFVSVGQDTGRRYMLTSRMSPLVNQYGKRTMYDLDRDEPVCVHDWSIPAAEELLALHVFLSLPGWETWMLELPLEGDHGVMD